MPDAAPAPAPPVPGPGSSPGDGEHEAQRPRPQLDPDQTAAGAKRGNGQTHREPSPAARSCAPDGHSPEPDAHQSPVLRKPRAFEAQRAAGRALAGRPAHSPPAARGDLAHGPRTGGRGNRTKNVHDAPPFASRDDPPLAGSYLGHGEGGPERSAAAGAGPCDHLIARADDDPVPLAQVTPHEVHLTARETGGGAQRHPALCPGRLGERGGKQREAHEAGSDAQRAGGRPPIPLDAMHLGLLLAPP